MRAVLIVNKDEADSGHVGHELRQRGYAFTELVREDWDSWPKVDDMSLVVSMGSAWSTYWPLYESPIKVEQVLMADALSRGIPILGICFGAQQLATVLGGTVKTAKITEIGWKMVKKLPETAHIAPDWLVSGPWMQWHADACSVPQGVTVLADSAAGPQAFVGKGCFGVQFHPEATESIVRMWSRGAGEVELAAQGLSRDDVMNDTLRHLEDAHQRCAQLVEWFIDTIVMHKDT